MNSLAPSQTLQWSPSGPRSFSLVDSQGDTLSTLTFATRDGSLATGKTSAGEWTFKRVGFFRPAISVRSPGAESNIALFQENQVRFGDGRTFIWKTLTKSSQQWAFVDPEAIPAVLQHARFGRRKCEGDVRIASSLPVTEPAVISVLVLLAWHIALLQHKDEEMGTLTAVLLMMG